MESKAATALPPRQELTPVVPTLISVTPTPASGAAASPKRPAPIPSITRPQPPQTNAWTDPRPPPARAIEIHAPPPEQTTAALPLTPPPPPAHVSSRCGNFGSIGSSNPSFRRQLEAGARAILAIGAAVLLILHPSTAGRWSVPVFAPLHALLAIGPNFGKTIENGKDLAIGNVCASISIAVALRIDLHAAGSFPLGCYVAGTTLLFGYIFTAPLMRKISIAVNASLLLVIVPLANAEPRDVPWFVLESTLTGVACAVGALLLPVPRFAARTLRECSRSFAGDARRLFGVSVRAFLCTDGDGTVSVLRIAAKNLLESVADRYHNTLRPTLPDAEWECAWLESTRLWLSAIRRDMDVTERALVAIRGMNHALEDLHSDTVSHREFVSELRQPLMQLNACVDTVLSAIADPNRDHSHPIPAIADMNGAWREVDAAYLRARRRIWYKIQSSAVTPAATPASALVTPSASAADTPHTEVGHLRADIVLTMNFFILNAQHFVHAIASYQPSLPADAAAAAVDAGASENGCSQLWSAIAGACRYVASVVSGFFQESIKCTVAVVLTSLLVLVPEAAASNPRGFWAPFTVALVMGDSLGSAWQVTARRLEGTVIGSLAGYFIDLVTDGGSLGLGLLVVAWNGICLFDCADPDNSNRYSSLVAAVSALVVTFGRDKATDSVQAYALYRITNTFLGVFASLLVNTFVFPVHSSHVVKIKILEAMTELRHAFTACFDMYHATPIATAATIGSTTAAAVPNGSPNAALAALAAMDDPLPHVLKARALIAVQELHLLNAVREPVLWRKKYPRTQLEALIRSERRVVLVARVFAGVCERLTVLSSKPPFIAHLQIELLHLFDLLLIGLRHDVSVQTGAAAAATAASAGSGGGEVERAVIHPEALVRLGRALRVLSVEHERWVRERLDRPLQPGNGAAVSNGGGNGSGVDQALITDNAGVEALSSFIFSVRSLIKEVSVLGHACRELRQYETPELYEL